MSIKQKDLIYKRINILHEEDKKIMDEILSFDTNKNCFGDYDFYHVIDEYINLAIYIENELIGYVGFSYINDENIKGYKDLEKYTIGICIKKEYQSKGIGTIILKQAIKTIFSTYNAKSINLEVVEDNYVCNKLLEKHNFSKDIDDTFLKDGKYVKSIHYVYTKTKYEEEKNKLNIYRKII